MDSAGETLEKPVADPVKLGRLASALTSVNQQIRAMIRDELKEMITEAEDTEAKAAQRLRDASGALKGPQDAIRDIEGEIARANAELSQWRGKLDSEDIGERVAARNWIGEWEAEVASLAQKKTRLDNDMMPLVNEHAEAKKELGQATAELSLLRTNIAEPYYYRGQEAKAYLFRIRYGLADILMTGNRAHPEWGKAIEQLEFLCIRTGYRTDKLPKESEAIKKYWDHVFAEGNPKPETTVSNVNETSQAEGTVMVQRSGAGTVTDHRTRSPGQIPRTVTERPELDYQRVPQEYRQP